MPNARTPEPPLLKRLRQAVRTSGLNADISSLPPADHCSLVTNRLTQTTVRALTDVDPFCAQQLTEELRHLGSPQEFDMLMEDRSYTFFHVVQFLYEYARHHARMPFFCAAMGRGGGGVEVAPDRQIISLLQLLPTALTKREEGSHLGLLMLQLVPQVLNTVFDPGLFAIEIRPEGEDRLRFTLHYADRSRLERCLHPLGLAEDAGAFFLNSALHFQGTILRGCDTFVREAEEAVHLERPIEKRTEQERREIAENGCSTWTLSWKADLRLNRLDDAQVIECGIAIYDALHRREQQYYLERIKSLEMRLQALEERDRFHELIGRSPQMHRVYQAIDQMAATDFTVLIRGESGTGKELVARAIHASSTRRDRPFVAVNCAAFSETLLESELFGHEKGAFTGADRQKPGRFEAADGGTLFLDEVGDVPLTTQVKLLRVLDTRSFERVGGTRSLDIEVRIIGATNRDLEEMIARGEYREDFYFRLNVLPIQLPPLREHREDIPLLAQHFLERTAQRTGKPVTGFARGAVDRLLSHSWPGNIRELLNVIERAVVVYARGNILAAADIARALGLQRPSPAATPLNLRQRQLLTAMRDAGKSCGIDDLLPKIRIRAGDTGTSRRTLQNDLRRIAELGYAVWSKQGNARIYRLTPQGAELATFDRP